MSKQSKPGQSKPITDEQKLEAAQARAKQCESEVLKVIERYQCQPIFAQRTIDGQLVPIRNLPLVLLFVPNESIQVASPEAA